MTSRDRDVVGVLSLVWLCLMRQFYCVVHASLKLAMLLPQPLIGITGATHLPRLGVAVEFSQAVCKKCSECGVQEDETKKKKITEEGCGAQAAGSWG